MLKIQPIDDFREKNKEFDSYIGLFIIHHEC